MNSKVRALIVMVVIVWAILVTAASLSSNNPFRVSISASGHSRHITVRRKHRLAHWAAFGVLSFLLAILCRRPSRLLVALVCVVTLGATIETLQHVIYRIPFETWDMRDDVYGTLTGFFAALLLVVITRKSRTLEV